MTPRAAVTASLAVLLAAAVAPAAAAGWADPSRWTREPGLVAHQEPTLTALRGSSVFVGADPGDAATARPFCMVAQGDGRLAPSDVCWSRDADGDSAGSRPSGAGRIVVGFALMGEDRCVAEVDGTQVDFPCCARTPAAFLVCYGGRSPGPLAALP